MHPNDIIKVRQLSNSHFGNLCDSKNDKQLSNIEGLKIAVESLNTIMSLTKDLRRVQECQLRPNDIIKI